MDRGSHLCLTPAPEDVTDDWRWLALLLLPMYVHQLCNLTLEEVRLYGWGSVSRGYERQEETNVNIISLKCYVLKSCEKSTKCPLRLLFYFVNLGLWFAPLPGLLLRLLHNFSLWQTLTWFPWIHSCKMKPWHHGKLLWHKTVFLTCDHGISLDQSSFKKKGHLYIL